MMFITINLLNNRGDYYVPTLLRLDQVAALNENAVWLAAGKMFTIGSGEYPKLLEALTTFLQEKK